MTTTTKNSKKTPSEIYFSASSSTKENSSYYYTHQDIKVSISRSSSSSSSSSNNDDSKNNVVHGRGLIATRDIQPGELLFITPPTLKVDTDILREMYFSEKRGESQNVSKKIINLEKLAMRLLENKMMDTTEVLEFDEENSSDEKNLGVLNSFLALMSGSHDNIKVEDILQSIDDSASASYIDVLNAKYSSTIWTPEELQSLFSRKSKKEIMKNIILKNAFGPDFITYDKIQYKWDLLFNQDNSNENENDDNNFPPHILGIFPLASMINHSCIPNAIRTFSSNGSIMICHASQKIKAGNEIVWSYIPPTLPFMERRRTLKKRHGFVCKCQRCLSESKFFSNQNLFPSLLKSAFKDGMKYNQTILNFSSESSNYQEMEKCIKAYQSIEDHLFSHDSADNNVITNELKRYLRVGFTNLHFNYFNSVLSLVSMMGAGNVITTKEQQTQHQVLNSATQLHFAFCSSNNACTEHLSLLHLCYELSNSTSNSAAIDAETAKKKIKFWTEQMKRTHMIRYGDMENNLETVRKCLVHTRSILRQQNGFLRMKHNFL